jgi:hypothetical protein
MAFTGQIYVRNLLAICAMTSTLCAPEVCRFRLKVPYNKEISDRRTMLCEEHRPCRSNRIEANQLSRARYFIFEIDKHFYTCQVTTKRRTSPPAVQDWEGRAFLSYKGMRNVG